MNICTGWRPRLFWLLSAPDGRSRLFCPLKSEATEKFGFGRLSAKILFRDLLFPTRLNWQWFVCTNAVLFLVCAGYHYHQLWRWLGEVLCGAICSEFGFRRWKVSSCVGTDKIWTFLPQSTALLESSCVCSWSEWDLRDGQRRRRCIPSILWIYGIHRHFFGWIHGSIDGGSCHPTTPPDHFFWWLDGRTDRCPHCFGTARRNTKKCHVYTDPNPLAAHWTIANVDQPHEVCLRERL